MGDRTADKGEGRGARVRMGRAEQGNFERREGREEGGGVGQELGSVRAINLKAKFLAGTIKASCSTEERGPGPGCRGSGKRRRIISAVRFSGDSLSSVWQVTGPNCSAAFGLKIEVLGIESEKKRAFFRPLVPVILKG